MLKQLLCTCILLALTLPTLSLAQPPTPTYPRAYPTSTGTVGLYWEYVQGADHYEVLALKSSPAPNLSSTAPINSWTDPSPTPGIPLYQVRACDYMNRCSPYTPLFSTTTQSPAPCPFPPHGSLIGCITPVLGGPNQAVLADTSIPSQGVLINLFSYWLPGLYVADNRTMVRNDASIGTWTGYLPFTAGRYLFRIGTNGAVRLLIDDQVVQDPYADLPGSFYTWEVPISTGGWHKVQLQTVLTPLSWVYLQYLPKP